MFNFADQNTLVCVVQDWRRAINKADNGEKGPKSAFDYRHCRERLACKNISLLLLAEVNESTGDRYGIDLCSLLIICFYF